MEIAKTLKVQGEPWMTGTKSDSCECLRRPKKNGARERAERGRGIRKIRLSVALTL